MLFAALLLRENSIGKFLHGQPPMKFIQRVDHKEKQDSCSIGGAVFMAHTRLAKSSDRADLVGNKNSSAVSLLGWWGATYPLFPTGGRIRQGDCTSRFGEPVVAPSILARHSSMLNVFARSLVKMPYTSVPPQYGPGVRAF